MARTTININKEIRDALAKKRKYSRETYDGVLKRLLQRDIAETRRKLN